jgi:aspartate-semialdehyde dehydrogenase
MRVAVVGATGAVGTVMRRKLRERGFPATEVVPFASARSVGREVDGVRCRALGDDTIQGFDLALFSAGATTSGEWAPRFVDAGAVVVDNSSRFRRDPEIPLVVSEVNPDALHDHKGLIANPNCSTMQLMVALKPIYDAAGIERLIVSTYQSVSGTGVRAVEELERQTRAALAGEPLPEPAVYPHPIAFNVLGGAGNFADGDDHTDEERKLMFETRKILGDESIAISVTCARVPVRNCHSESVNLQTREALSPEQARALLAEAPGLRLSDPYPTALDGAGSDDVLVGRLRRDPSHERGLQMWVVSDNLLKGAATNAVQIAEALHERDLVRVPTRV